MTTHLNELSAPVSLNSNGARTPRILVVEDNSSFALSLVHDLQADGFLVEHVDCVDAARLHLATKPTDLIILDRVSPGKSGLEFCRDLREGVVARNISVIILSARSEESDRLRTGVDDHLAQPFSIDELKARVHALLRRAYPECGLRRLSVGNIELDRDSHRVSRDGRKIHLTPKAFSLLEYFMASPGRVFTRAQLIEGIWGTTAEIDERTVDVHVQRLRKELARGRERNPIRTIRSVGYAFDEAAPHK